jgi:hypothetical protein
MEIKYYSTSYTADSQTIKDRISFYLESDNFEIIVSDSTNVIFEVPLTKDEFLKVDVAMNTIGYIRY